MKVLAIGLAPRDRLWSCRCIYCLSSLEAHHHELAVTQGPQGTLVGRGHCPNCGMMCEFLPVELTPEAIKEVEERIAKELEEEAGRQGLRKRYEVWVKQVDEPAPSEGAGG